MGEETTAVSIEEIAKACGIKRVRTIDPYNQKATHEIIAQELNADEPSVIVSKGPCVLKERKVYVPKRKIAPELCVNCRACLKLGCPSIESIDGGKPSINAIFCEGCTLCEQVCKFGAISMIGADNE